MKVRTLENREQFVLFEVTFEPEDKEPVIVALRDNVSKMFVNKDIEGLRKELRIVEEDLAYRTEQAADTAKEVDLLRCSATQGQMLDSIDELEDHLMWVKKYTKLMIALKAALYILE